MIRQLKSSWDKGFFDGVHEKRDLEGVEDRLAYESGFVEGVALQGKRLKELLRECIRELMECDHPSSVSEWWKKNGPEEVPEDAWIMCALACADINYREDAEIEIVRIPPEPLSGIIYVIDIKIGRKKR